MYGDQTLSTLQVPRAPARLSLVRSTVPDRVPLGEILIRMGAIGPDDLLQMRQLQSHQAGTLGEILIAQGVISEQVLLQALARQFDTRIVTASGATLDPALVDTVGLARCLRLQCLPLRNAGAVTVVATPRPDQFDRHRPILEAALGPVVPVVMSERGMHALVLRTRRQRLKLWAETSVAGQASCRTMRLSGLRHAALAVLLLLAFLLILFPAAVMVALLVVVGVFLALTSALKLLAALAAYRYPESRAPPVPGNKIVIQRKPIVTLLVPLYKEPETVPRLLRRLARLTWPRNLLDVLLIVEEDDHATRAALAAAQLPRWMRIIPVPDARLRTKPRALNHAMLFARGSIVGVYDAEDAPEPDQIHRVVQCFNDGPPDLACVQGVLDFYNPRANWIARCFTIEYAVWFRLILPGMQRLGLAVPLGGTTLFFRRDVLERLGGWDAHNVTEDADLGIRLARHGYYTQLLDTVTYEEANCRALPWVKQRSRWLKGYAVTWLVHMRAPMLLWRQLGAWRFFGVQVLFLGTLVQFALAPLLWSFWLILLGIGHPLLAALPMAVIIGFIALFLLSEAITLSIGFLALRARHHRHLRLWLPALHAYFPLAVLAVYKALWELLAAPYYWDKTSHGAHGSALDVIAVHGQS
ncbi:MAG: glycosyltransferase [Rhodobacteraceae bacterium]|nr:glycosyltransferase [Paracoccaceae bacterium]